MEYQNIQDYPDNIIEMIKNIEPVKNIYMGSRAYSTLINSFIKTEEQTFNPFNSVGSIAVFMDTDVPDDSYFICTSKEFELYKHLKNNTFMKYSSIDEILKAVSVLYEETKSPGGTMLMTDAVGEPFRMPPLFNR